jgi:hypothetical protein
MSVPCGAYGLSTPYRETSYAAEVNLAGHDPYLQNSYASNDSLSGEDGCISEQCIFPSAAPTEETFHLHLQKDAMACESEVTQLSDSLSWTDAMYKRLLVFKKEAAESEEDSTEVALLYSWERAALDINHIFNTTVKAEHCEQKYQRLIRKVARYYEVYGHELAPNRGQEECTFNQAAFTEETFYLHSQRDAMVCEGEVTQPCHSPSWTAAMCKRLLVFKKGTAESVENSHNWQMAALDINHMFNTTVTAEHCEQKYEGHRRKVAIYHEVFGQIPTGVQFELIEGAEFGDMEWDEDRDNLLKKVVEEKKSKSKRSYWDEVKEEMNKRLQIQRTRACYEGRYRKLSLGVDDLKFSSEETEVVKREIQSGNYYKFSETGKFKGLYYAAIGGKFKKAAIVVSNMISSKKNREDPFFKKIKEIEIRRRSGESISKQALYTFLGEFAPPAKTSLSTQGKVHRKTR